MGIVIDGLTKFEQEIRRKSVLLINHGVIGGTSGKLLVIVNGGWGTVNDDMLDGNDQTNNNVAMVVCRMLGLTGGQVHTSDTNSLFGPTDGYDVRLRSLGCDGNEDDIYQCQQFVNENLNNYHGDELGITCEVA